MSYTYDQRKRPQRPDQAGPRQTAAPGPGMESLMAGTARPTAAQKGQPFDLDAAIKAKMENAFGDLSAVKFYRSQAVGDAGAEAIAQGNEIAFAPGMADFSTKAGQERLGHELSHVMSQRSGQVRGSGFLNNASLEARADREGAMAAAGKQVYAGPVSHALSGAAPSPMAAGTMQARRDVDRAERIGASMLFDQDRENFYKNSGKTPRKLVTEKEKAWFDSKMMSEDRGFFQEIIKRQNAARDRLIKHREAMGPEVGPNAGMLDYEASFSAPGQDMRLYDLMTKKASMNRSFRQVSQENLYTPEEAGNNAWAKEMINSPFENDKDGAPIRKELLNPKLRYLFLRSAGWNKEGKKLLSDAGKQYRIKHIDAPRIKNDLSEGEPPEDNLIPQPAPKPKSKVETTADELFRIQAGILADAEETTLTEEQEVNRLMPQFLAEEQKNGDHGAADRARLKAKEYYKKHVPKRRNITRPKDRGWYSRSMETPTVELLSELQNRRNQAALDAYDYRESLERERPDDDKSKLNVEAAYSEPMNKMSIYDTLIRGMMMSPAYEKYLERLEEQETSPETEEKLNKASTMLASGSKYAKSEEGKKHTLKLQKQQIEAMKDIYSGVKKKKNGLR